MDKIGLIIVMVIAAVGMIYGLNKQKTGAAWGKPMAIVCALIALGAAIMHLVGQQGPSTDTIIKIEQNYQQAAGEVLGKYLASEFQGKKAVVLAMPVNPGQQAQPNMMVEGLRKGLGSAVTITDVIRPEIPEEIKKQFMVPPPPGAEGEGMEMSAIDMVPIEEWFNAGMLDRIMKQNSNVDLVITTMGLPMDVFQATFWRDKNAPKLVVASGSIYELKGAIKAGRVAAAIAYNPEAKYEPKMAKGTLDEIFDKRFILVTPKNVDEVAGKHQGLFMDAQGN